MGKLTRRAVVAGALAVPFVARAEEWPAGQIKFIVPFPAGGTLDAIARLVQPGLQQRLGTTIIIENRPGAAGSIGAAAAAKSPPDGRTWLFVFDTHATNPVTQPSLPYNSDIDLDPVMLVGTAPNIIACQPTRPYQTLSELIAASKVKQGGFAFASAGTASLGHLTMLLLAKRSGAQWTHVAYKGAAPAVNDAIAGHIDLIIAATTVLNSQIDAKSLRPLAQTGATRHPTLPNVPTLVESGFPDLVATPWWGLYAPGKTPKPMVARFNADLSAVLKEDGVMERINAMGLTIVASDPEYMRKFYTEQAQIWGQVVRDNGLRAEGG
ncbi:tripartite tricarboxylate transporter substrate-binding protein [Bradyrhizobium sp. SSUT18]|uniref:Bug family tripartite tricarboxylate transporter substrate binding protein n=1 Tax=Bradyrhizobium sp. SSUT18 TaxID=3040602 RepID=UPI0024498E74|nr:tripartite tricarboxylate transporter substrate-binding protein [Bradyrhizobium sp. SSUT18]MDH2403709.1 tripartite tricarboxylate transporter substrate-binding protein [Bradyrhizobium sp. SSUT18]